mmetsp:Transcript_28834/g.62743  ORF Transcript_28834/g.62743 Transcript_28834/m.62743 type:complete len:200 (+) Transcript_28834:111-710(+)
MRPLASSLAHRPPPKTLPDSFVKTDSRSVDVLLHLVDQFHAIDSLLPHWPTHLPHPLADLSLSFCQRAATILRRRGRRPRLGLRCARPQKHLLPLFLLLLLLILLLLLLLKKLLLLLQLQPQQVARWRLSTLALSPSSQARRLLEPLDAGGAPWAPRLPRKVRFPQLPSKGQHIARPGPPSPAGGDVPAHRFVDPNADP